MFKKSLRSISGIVNSKLVKETLLDEGIYDKGILKAFFVAGGPGSGKSFVTNKITAGQGVKFINSDIYFEKLLKDAELSLDLDYLARTDPEGLKKAYDIRGRAKTLSTKTGENFLMGRLPVVYDGTGAEYDKIKRKKERCEALGYDTYMLFVNTSLEVAMERNRKRARTLPDDLVKEMWYAVQNNLGKYQNLFGAANVIIIDNTEFSDNILNKMWKRIKSILDSPVKNPIGKRWKKDALQAKRDGL